MCGDIKSSWVKILNPKVLKDNLINASIYCMAFEILKESIKNNILAFYSDGFGENGIIISKDYRDEVLTLNKNPIFASLKWLKNQGCIDDTDINLFKEIKKNRNELTHELLKIASEGCTFDIEKSLSHMILLLKKIETWWFVNFELEINSENYSNNLDVDNVIMGKILILQMLFQTALGSEDDAMNIYNKIILNENNE